MTYYKTVQMLLSVVLGKYVVLPHLNNRLHKSLRFIQDQCFVIHAYGLHIVYLVIAITDRMYKS